MLTFKQFCWCVMKQYSLNFSPLRSSPWSREHQGHGHRNVRESWDLMLWSHISGLDQCSNLPDFKSVLPIENNRQALFLHCHPHATQKQNKSKRGEDKPPPPFVFLVFLRDRSQDIYASSQARGLKELYHSLYHSHSYARSKPCLRPPQLTATPDP